MTVWRWLFILCVLSGLVFYSCEKLELNEMTVIKDCTGDYLRWMDKDYLICNTEKVKKFESGAPVKASFVNLEECDREGQFCDLLHPYAGIIKVNTIRSGSF